MKRLLGYTLLALGSPGILCFPFALMFTGGGPEGIKDAILFVVTFPFMLVGMPFLPLLWKGMELIGKRQEQ